MNEGRTGPSYREASLLKIFEGCVGKSLIRHFIHIKKINVKEM